MLPLLLLFSIQKADNFESTGSLTTRSHLIFHISNVKLSVETIFSLIHAGRSSTDIIPELKSSLNMISLD